MVLRKGQLLRGTYTGRAGLTSGLPGARAVRLRKKGANEGAQLSGGPGDDLAAAIQQPLQSRRGAFNDQARSAR
jgi:hypothetical protein